MALKGKPARFYRPRSGNRDEVIFDADEIDGMRPQSPAQILPPAAAGAAISPQAGPSGQAMLAVALARLLERVSAPPALAPPPPRDWLTPAEAAASEGLTENFIRGAIRRGALRVVRDGAGYKVHRSSLANLATLATTTNELRADLARRKGAHA